MMISRIRICLVVIFLLTAFQLNAQLVYEKGGITYELSETEQTYVVKCQLPESVMDSRQYNLAVGRSRLTAKNIIGLGILFRTHAKSDDLQESSFQNYVDHTSDSFVAVVFELTESQTDVKNEIIYECRKTNIYFK